MDSRYQSTDRYRELLSGKQHPMGLSATLHLLPVLFSSRCIGLQYASCADLGTYLLFSRP